MKRGDNKKEQLMTELRQLRRRVAELEAAEAERKRAQEALRKSEAKYRFVHEDSPSVNVIIGVDGRITDVNKAAITKLGYAREEVIGKEALEFVVPEERGDVASQLEIAFKGEDTTEIEVGVYAKDGSVHTILFSAGQVLLYEQEHPTAVLFTGIDVTEARRAERALRDSEALYQSLVESLPQNIFRKDREGKFTFGNRNFCGSLGKTLDEIVGKTDFDFYPAELAEKYRADDRRVMETRHTFEDVEEHHTPDGRRLYVRVVKTPLYDSKGDVAGVQGIFWDVTERKRAETERESIARLGLRLAGADTIERMATVVREETDRLLAWDAHYFAVRRAGEDTFSYVCFADTVSGEKKTFPREDWPVTSLSAPIRPVLDGCPVLVNRTPGDPKPVLAPFGDKERISASLMYAPVRSGESAIGIISVQSYSYNRYCQADLQTLQRMADVVAPAIERAYAAQALRRSEERYRRLVENAHEGIWLIDAEAKTTFVNPRMAEMLAYTVEEMLGKSLFSFMDESSVRLARYLFERRKRGIKERHDFEFLRKDGGLVYVTLATSPIVDDEGNFIGALAFVADVTERKEAEREKRRLEEELAHAQKMESLGVLAGGIAHEFNNILAAIIGYTDMTLQAEQLSESARRNLEVARTSAARGAALTRSLLTFSRKDVGEKKPVNLKELVDELLDMTAKEFVSQGIHVTVKHSTNAPPVMGNAGLLSSAVMNLVINARHAMLKSAVKKLDIETGMEKGKAFIRVRDTGCGIPREHLSRIFEPFFTTKGALAGGEVLDGKARGTGLGLSVCHSIVEGHGGEITVKSEVGKGTTFTVYLPAASRAARPKTEKKRKPGAFRILVVDDEEAITDLLVDILGQGGYDADGFTDPRHAVRAIARGDYSLAFIDLQMPQMMGEDFMDAINRLPGEKRPLKVILTGHMGVSQDDYERLGVFAVLAKPFASQQVLEIVERGLSAREKAFRGNGEGAGSP